MLVNTSMQRASAEQAFHLREGLGDPHLGAEAINDLRAIIVATGALDEAEDLITRRTDEALAALDRVHLAGAARVALEQLAIAATGRSV